MSRPTFRPDARAKGSRLGTPFRERIWQRPTPLGALLALVLAVLVSWPIVDLAPVHTIQQSRHDLQRRWLAAPPQHRHALRVDVDEDSVRRLAERYGPWPLRREAYATAGDYLFRAGAKAVVYDMVFADRRDGDPAFAQHLGQAAGPVVLAASVLPQPIGERSAPAPRSAPAALEDCVGRDWPAWLWPVFGRGEGGVGLGAITTTADLDGYLRTLDLWSSAQGVTLPSLPLAAWLASNGVDAAQARCGAGWVEIGPRRWPIDAQGRLWLRFESADAPAVPFVDVLAADEGSLPAARAEALAERVRGKVVFIGSTAALGQRVPTPVGQREAAALMTATYEALQTDHVFHPPRPAIDHALMAVCALPLLAGWRRRRLRPAAEFAWIGAALGLLLVVDLLLASVAGQMSGIGWPVLTLLGYGLLMLWRWRDAMLADERRLRREREAADAENQLKSEFLAHMSHEIRTPMNALLGATELLARTELDQRQKGYVDLFQSAGAQLMDILDDVLDLSKIDAGMLEVTARPFSLSALVAAQVALFMPRADQRGLALRTETEGELPETVVGDPKRLSQVLRNLLGNAIKFTPNGSVTLALYPGSRSDRVRFEVRDTGIGIPSERLDAVFRPFTQADRTIPGRFGGTGLGLAISQRLVRLMGGELDARSVEGQGSTFHFELHLPPSAEAPVAAWDDSGSRFGTAPAGHLHILLADDNPHNVIVVEAFLEGCGHTLEVVSDGREAVERCRLTRYDVVLLDMQMPVLDGYGAAAAIRALERQRGGARMPIVALTANVQAREIAQALDAGCDEHLPKPFSRGQLLAALARHAPLVPSGPGSVPPLMASDDGVPASSGLPGAEASDLARTPLAAADADDRVDASQGRAAAGTATMDRPTEPAAAAIGPLAASATAPIAAFAANVAIDGAEPWDRDAALARLGGNGALFARVLALTLDALRSADRRFDAALSAGDLGAARRVAHDLKSNAALLGFDRVSQAAAALELRVAGGASAGALRDDPARDGLRASVGAVLDGFPPADVPPAGRAADPLG